MKSHINWTGKDTPYTCMDGSTYKVDRNPKPDCGKIREGCMEIISGIGTLYNTLKGRNDI
ncbi:MAG: hypothetical protein Kow0021_09830 [Methanothermobacter thermautotrophicus]|uniref:Uncharacterized protein n=1 Tax=Methanothermobacter thermautotrophicus (strain ATCC 29096 / DSM 1053 / JCM 10044 / NBRC 100330 / Delta H) TaxID=187420 RepID=O26202_METTH|nr:unknown [Methanothermobacter thermautotrophicus str. Delta H]